MQILDLQELLITPTDIVLPSRSLALSSRVCSTLSTILLTAWISSSRWTEQLRLRRPRRAAVGVWMQDKPELDAGPYTAWELVQNLDRLLIDIVPDHVTQELVDEYGKAVIMTYMEFLLFAKATTAHASLTSSSTPKMLCRWIILHTSMTHRVAQALNSGKSKYVPQKPQGNHGNRLVAQPDCGPWFSQWQCSSNWAVRNWYGTLFKLIIRFSV